MYIFIDDLDFKFDIIFKRTIYLTNGAFLSYIFISILATNVAMDLHEIQLSNVIWKTNIVRTECVLL